MLPELTHLIDALPGLAWTALPDGRAEFFNRRWLDYTGLTSQQAADLGWIEAIHPDDRERVGDHWRACLTSGVAADTEARIRRYDGVYRCFLFRANPVRDATGNISRWLGTNVDREDGRRGAEAPQSHERDLTLIINTIPAHIYVLNTEGAVQYVNQGVMDYTGLTLEDVQQEDYRDRVIHPDDFQSVRAPRAAGLRRGAPFSTEQRVLGSNRQYRWFLVRYKPLLDEQGRIVRWYVAAFDIEDRKRAVDQVQLLANMMHAIPAAVWSVTPDGAPDVVNQGCYDYTGHTPEYVDSHPEAWMATMHPDDADAAGTTYWGGIRSGSGFTMEARFLRARDKAYRWHLNRAVAVRDATGNVIRFVGTSTDIEDLKVAQEALHNLYRDLADRERESRMIVDGIPGMVALLTASGEVEVVNPQLIAYFDQAVERLREWRMTDTIHPADLPHVVEVFSQSIASGSPYEIVQRFRRSDGVYRWFLNSGLPVRDASGQIARWCVLLTDIDERKRAEDALRASEGNLQLIIDTIPALAWAARPDGSAEFFNQHYLDFVGGSAKQTGGWGWTAAVHPDDLAALTVAWQHILASRQTGEAEARLRRQSDGAYRWFLFRANPLRDDAGEIVRWFGVNTDIEDRKQAEAALGAVKDQLYKENLLLRDEVDRTSMFEEIVGTSPALQPVLSRVAKVARTDSTVLITGETGTGKELIARAIHRRSARASRAFVSVNCAAVPRELIASELFGHEKGAFTGATQRRLGRFELAHGGTMFLDEAGELPMETQVALLRVLQERQFERVGGSTSIRIDVRVVAATNRDLPAAIQAGSFRSDLFYRLNVFPIAVPALRERADDIPLLVEYFIDRYARKAGKTIRRLNKRTLDHLRSYPWPGNVRELQNVIERSVIVCDTDEFTVDESWVATRADIEGRLALSGSLAAHEKAIIEDALRASGGRVFGPSGAAARLGIPRSTLESKIRALKISKSRFRGPAKS